MGSLARGRTWWMVALCAALLLAACASPAMAYAESVQYVERNWNGSQVVEQTKTADCKSLSDDGDTTLSGWYVTTEDTIGSKLVVNGTANIIVRNGITLRCEESIYVPSGSTLNIFGQSGDSGSLDVIGDTNCAAGIGGEEKKPCGTINIHGGKVYSVGDDNSSSSGEGGAGIGGGDETGAGEITIYGGEVTGIGATNAAGIGGGDGEDNAGGGSGGSIKIYGGTVKGSGGSVSSEGGAGIGSGAYCNNTTVEIFGGNVTGHGGPDAAGIGGGWKGSGGTIVIGSGTIDAKGGSEHSNGGAGIGGGGAGHSGTITIGGNADITAQGGANAAGIGGGDEGECGTIVIHSGTVKAYGGSKHSDGGAGIGGGNEKNGGTIRINGGNVTAQGGCDAAGIGGGDCGSGGDIEIHNATVNATGGSYGAGIGGGDADSSGRGHGGTVKIYDSNVTANGGTDAAGIGGGEGGGGATVDIYGNATVNAFGGSSSEDGGAGIGSGDKDGKNVDGGTVRVHAGEVTAVGGPDAAGIGGGDDCNAGSIMIESGMINASSKKLGAGIGGGQNGNGGTITISGGTVIATGGYDGAGIGGGESGDGGNIAISGGTITATGGSNFSSGAAGIGGGDSGGAGTINITGGDLITAQGGNNAAGIGSGIFGKSGSVTISNGTIRATGGDRGAGIGGGYANSYSEDPNNKIEVTISGGNVTASGGKQASGIGGGFHAVSGPIRITNGTVNATGGNDGGAGIGSGVGCSMNNHTTVNVTIDGGNITATAGGMVSDSSYDPGAAIGTGGYERRFPDDDMPSYFNGSITFNGGRVTAYGASTDDQKFLEKADQQNPVGTTSEKNLLGVTGKVAFNGATVTMLPKGYRAEDDVLYTYSSAVRASDGQISFKDEGDALQAVRQGSGGNRYPDIESNPERLKALTQKSEYVNWVEVHPAHQHVFTYKVDESDQADILAICTDSCWLTDKKSRLTLFPPSHKTYNDGKNPGALIWDRDRLFQDDEKVVKYYKADENGDKVGNELSSPPVDAGKYRVEFTLGTGNNSATAFVIHDIARARSGANVMGTANVVQGKTIDLADNVSLPSGLTSTVSYKIEGDANNCTVDSNGILTSTDQSDPNKKVSVKVTVDTGDNYEVLVSTIIVTITEKPKQTIDADDVTATYGDTGKSVTASVTEPETDGGAISYKVKAGGEEYIDVDASTGALTIKKAGTAYVTVTAAMTNTCAETTKDVKVSIDKAPLTVQPFDSQSKTYGEPDPTDLPSKYAVDGLKNGDTREAVLTGELVRDAGEDAGNGYRIWQGTLQPNDNYYIKNYIPEWFTIEQKPIKVAVTVEDKVYDGTTSAKVTAAINADDLVGDDSVVFYRINGSFESPDAGVSKEVIIDTTGAAWTGSGSGNYNVEIPEKATATITPRSATVMADNFSKAYNESDPELSATVYNVVDGEALDYSLTREEGSDVGDYDINVVLGNNPNYTVWPIKGKFSITNAKFDIAATGYSGAYDGEAHGISVTAGPESAGAEVYYATEELTAGNYQTVGSTDSMTFTDASANTVYYLVVAPNYETVTGSAVVAIAKAASKAVAPTPTQGLAYTGKAQALIAPGSAEGGTMQYSLDGEEYSQDVPTATKPGFYAVLYRVVGDDNHNNVDAKVVITTIAKADISKAQVELDQTNFTNDGKAKEPAVKSVMLDGKALEAGTDYTVSYKDNTAAGTAIATVTGKGNYTGTATATFTIAKEAEKGQEKEKPTTPPAAKVSIAKAKVVLAKKSYAYDGKAKQPKVKSVVLDGKKLNASDYTVTYANNKKLGTAIATVTGKGNYKGTAKATFAIKLGRAKALTIGRNKAKAIEVGWAKVKGAKSYELQWRERGGTWKSASFKATNVTVQGMKKGKLYDFRVRAIAGKSKGTWSKQAHRWFVQQRGVKAASKKTGTVTASWKKTANANAGYLVVVRYAKGGKAVAKLKVASGKTKATVKGLAPGKKAWVQVRALHSAGGTTYGGMLTNAKPTVKVAGKPIKVQSAGSLQAATL